MRKMSGAGPFWLQNTSQVPTVRVVGVGGEGLLRKGVAAEDVEYPSLILNPEPAERWTAQDILSCGYLEID